MTRSPKHTHPLCKLLSQHLGSCNLRALARWTSLNTNIDCGVSYYIHSLTFNVFLYISCMHRWLEDPDAPETVEFVEAQNNLTNKVLEQCKTRDQFKILLTSVFNYPRYSCPFKRGDRCDAQPQSCLSWLH